MSPPRITTTIDDDGVADVVLNRPEKMNALDPAMFEAFVETIDRLAGTRGLRAVVLSGAGRAFCAGLDMASFTKMSEGAYEAGSSVGVDDLLRRSHGLANGAQQTAWGWHQLPVPVIAALHGVAFGGGLQIALGADIRLASADLKMAVMEIRWGLVPDMAGMPLMRALARDDVVRELTYTGRIFSGAEAVALGFATRVCDDPHAAATEMARAIARNSPEAVRAAKRLLNAAAAGSSSADLLMAESVEQQKLVGSPNQSEAVRAGMAKRPAVFED